MSKHLAALLLIPLAAPAAAETCPERYRFVDFGTESRDGTLLRGGTIFRAFDPSDTPLLLPAETICLDVPDLYKDGQQLDIPVVSEIAVNMDVATIEMVELRLSKSDDPIATSDSHAAAHLDALARPGAQAIRTASSLCVTAPEDRALSCQIRSPFNVTAAPVIYCNGETCEAPAIVFNTQVLMKAVWPQPSVDAAEMGPALIDRLEALRQYLTGHI